MSSRSLSRVTRDNFILSFLASTTSKQSSCDQRNNNHRTAAWQSRPRRSPALSQCCASVEFPTPCTSRNQMRRRKTFWDSRTTLKTRISHNLNFNFVCAAVPKASSSLVSQSFSSYKSPNILFVQQAPTAKQVATSFLESVSNQKFTRSEADGKYFIQES